MKYIQDFHGGTSSDGRVILVELTSTEAKRISIAFDNQQMARFVPLLAGLAQMAADKLPPSQREDIEKGARAVGKPIETTSAKIAPGSDGGMLFTVRVGTMDLAFRIPAEAKARLTKDLASLGLAAAKPQTDASDG
ncbi:MAG: hypothetical protein R6W92_00045 [Desulfocurvibacter africanus]